MLPSSFLNNFFGFYNKRMFDYFKYFSFSIQILLKLYVHYFSSKTIAQMLIKYSKKEAIVEC